MSTPETPEESLPPSSIDPPKPVPHIQKVEAVTREMFSKVQDYLNGELQVTTQEYQLLAKLNQLGATKYAEMTETSEGLVQSMKELHGKFEHLLPYIEQINEIETGVGQLEHVVNMMDEYTKRLEAKFKKIPRR